MTRGTVVIYTSAYIYCSTEFNGDMAPSQEAGKLLIEKLQTYKDAFWAVAVFNDEIFKYPEGEKFGTTKASKSFTVKTKQKLNIISDYTYVINLTGSDIKVMGKALADKECQVLNWDSLYERFKMFDGNLVSTVAPGQVVANIPTEVPALEYKMNFIGSNLATFQVTIALYDVITKLNGTNAMVMMDGVDITEKTLKKDQQGNYNICNVALDEVEEGLDHVCGHMNLFVPQFLFDCVTKKQKDGQDAPISNNAPKKLIMQMAKQYAGLMQKIEAGENLTSKEMMEVLSMADTLGVDFEVVHKNVTKKMEQTSDENKPETPDSDDEDVSNGDNFLDVCKDIISKSGEIDKLMSEYSPEQIGVIINKIGEQKIIDRYGQTEAKRLLDYSTDLDTF